MSFSIDLETESFDQSDLMGSHPTVRIGIRVVADGRSLTGPSDRFSVSDYFPGFARKAAGAVEAICNSEPATISFNATNCDIIFTPGSGEAIYLHAKRSDGAPRVEGIPDQGIPVDTAEVIQELLRVSEWAYQQFQQIPEANTHDRIEELGEWIASAKRSACSNGYLD